MRKVHSLIQLEELGLNTPKRLISLSQFMPSEAKIQSWRDLKATLSQRRDYKVSLRTERDGEFKTPHYPNIDLETASEHMAKLCQEGYAILICKGIDPHFARFAGNIAFHDKTKITCEWLEGCVTVRDLEKSTPNKWEYDATENKAVVFPNPIGKILGPLYPALSRKTLEGKIFEWSIYSTPVGEYLDSVIFWEIRPWT